MSQAIKTAIIMTAEYYGRQISETVLGMYASDLEDLDPAEVVAAYTRYRRMPANRTFPLPAQIRELVHPEQFISDIAKAREISARIVGAISQFGWANARDARAFIGPEGWSAVQRQGGWSYLCENVGTKISATTLQAQLRDQIEGAIKYGGALEQAIHEPAQIGPRVGSLERAGFGIQALIPSGDDDTPKGAA